MKSPADAAPFVPLSLRVVNMQGKVMDGLRSVEPFVIEVEYRLTSAITGLRVGCM